MMDCSIIRYRPIGYVRTPFIEKTGTPIQPCYSTAEGYIVISPEYSDGLADLDGFSHLILIYHFHQVKNARLKVTPFLDDKEHGIFATRAPLRPNPIGISIVRLVSIEQTNNTIRIQGVDMLDGTPLLDIKPYIPPFDQAKTIQTGWLKPNNIKNRNTCSNGRF
ncbi:MAG: tRNA (N6-threonylcarbamoyladenosine(37)-N6)-methyltransferase TrmO [Candidatus Ranarchaeia archaeon]